MSMQLSMSPPRIDSPWFLAMNVEKNLRVRKTALCDCMFMRPWNRAPTRRYTLCMKSASAITVSSVSWATIGLRNSANNRLEAKRLKNAPSAIPPFGTRWKCEVKTSRVKQGTYIERRECTRHKRPIIQQWSCACFWRQVLLRPLPDGFWALSVSCPWNCLWSHVEKVKTQLNLLNLINWSPPPKLSLCIHGLIPWVSGFLASSQAQTRGSLEVSGLGGGWNWLSLSLRSLRGF